MKQISETHISEEELVDGYYTGLAFAQRAHLDECSQCSTLYRSICDTLETASVIQPPERGFAYGQEVWARVSLRIAHSQKRRHKTLRRWSLIPALAAGAAIVFSAGTWNDRQIQLVPKAQITRARTAPNVKRAGLPNVPSLPLVRRDSGHKKAVAVPEVALSNADQDAKLLALNTRLENDAQTALPQLLEMINGDTSDKTKEHALFVLAQSDSSEAHRALLTFASQSSNLPLQRRAARIISLMGEDSAARELGGPYKASTSQKLKLEISNVPVSSDPKMVPLMTIDKRQILNSVFSASDSQVLFNVLKQEKNPDLRVATIRSLAVLGERSQVLVNIYESESDEKVRKAVLDALVVQQKSDILSDLARNEVDSERKREILTRVAKLQSQVGVR